MELASASLPVVPHSLSANLLHFGNESPKHLLLNERNPQQNGRFLLLLLEK